MVSFDEPVENAWMRSHARCEGRRGPHPQGDRCGRDLVWERRGQTVHRGAWEAHHTMPGVAAGWEAAKQIEILCWHCYQRVTRGTVPAQQNAKTRTAAAANHSAAEPRSRRRPNLTEGSGAFTLDSRRGST